MNHNSNPSPMTTHVPSPKSPKPIQAYQNTTQGPKPINFALWSQIPYWFRKSQVRLAPEHATKLIYWDTIAAVERREEMIFTCKSQPPTTRSRTFKEYSTPNWLTNIATRETQCHLMREGEREERYSEIKQKMRGDRKLNKKCVLREYCSIVYKFEQ